MDSDPRYDMTAHAVREIHQEVESDFPGQTLDRRERFRLHREYVHWLLDGEKETTIRYVPGGIDVPALKVLPLLASEPGEDGGEEIGRVEVVGLTVKPFGELTAADAERDGFERLSDLIGALTDIYGDIPDDHPVSIYELVLVGPPTTIRDRLEQLD